MMGNVYFKDPDRLPNTTPTKTQRFFGNIQTIASDCQRPATTKRTIEMKSGLKDPKPL